MKRIIFAGIIILAIAACKVQPSAELSLYVNNKISVIDSGEATLEMVKDTALTYFADTSTIKDQELPVVLHPDDEILKVSSDSIYRQKVKKLLKVITDSIELMHHQIAELQNQHIIKTDTNSTGKSIYKEQPPDSLLTEVDFKKMLQVKIDSIAILRNQMAELKKSASLKADTVYIEKDPKEITYKPINDTTILLLAFYESEEIKPLDEDSILKQINELVRMKNVRRITLSAYSDSSGSEIINKEITNRRLNYLSEKITQWIAKEKLIIQSIGDDFASNMAAKDERRIEIRIHIK